jgi:CDP-diacylglycerol--glycerol-3-phosphate 3-phosphatidyltransferase
MNLSISLTLLRILLVPLVVMFLLVPSANNDLWAVGIFLLGGATDLLDGYLARKREQITRLGILLDPIADKLLTYAAFICLVGLGLVPAWMVVIIVGRELAVSGLRAVASAQGLMIEASDLGKTKMVLQVAAISVVLLERPYPALRLPGQALLWLVILFALWSAWQYFWNFGSRLGVSVHQSAPRPSVVLAVEAKEQEEKHVAAHRS